MHHREIENVKATTPQSLWAGILLGIGIMAGVDEIIFHQVLSWHHFYDRSTSAIALMSDGLLHVAELIVIVAGSFMLLDLQRSKMIRKGKAWAGFFLGLGGFQLFDGIIDHKVLRIHQIRYVDNLLPYDVSWNLAGLILLGVGLIILKRPETVEKA